MDVEAIKAANPIEQVIQESGVELRKAGLYLRGVEHDSLVVDPRKGAFFWNSEGRSGDVIDWVTFRQRCDFMGAVEWLCRRARIEPPRWGEQSSQEYKAARAIHDALTVGCRHFVRLLRKTPMALAYCIARGWTEETIQEAGLGYYDGDRQGLTGELSMHGIKASDPAAKALLGIPAGMLVYPHVVAGRVVYFTTRMASRDEKRHWNPPLDLVGARQPYYNHVYTPGAELVVVVEGQADAVTLGMWGIAAAALAGVSPSPELLKHLGGHRTVVLGLDSDATGSKSTQPLAESLGPMTRIVRWPDHDCNDWLQAGATAEQANELLQEAAPWVMIAAERAGQIDGIERGDAVKAVMRLITRMDTLDQAFWREKLAKGLGLGLRAYETLLKAAKGECQADDEGQEQTLIELFVPGGYIGNHLLEMIVIPPAENNGSTAGWRTRFAARFPGGDVRVVDYVDIDKVRYVPVSPMSRMLTERVVQFPDQLGESLPLKELVLRVKAVIHKYMDVDVFYEWLSAYYVIFSWVYDCFNTLPYIRLLGDAGTGKSRFLQVVGALCYRPMFVNGAATVSPIFRMIDVYRGTLILDEGDYKNSDEAADIIKILNTGYQRVQGVVLRSGDKNSGFETEVFVTYCPKIVATRKAFADWALESRCLTYETGGPTTRTDIPIDLPRSFWTHEAPAVRNLLLRYRLERWQPEIELNYDSLDVASVEPRLNQVTVALQTLIDDPDLARDLRLFIQEYNRQMIVERGMTLSAKVLEAIVGLHEIDPSQVTLPLRDITQATNILIDAENEENAEEVEAQEEEEDKKGHDNWVKARKIGEIIRKTLHMSTERGAEGRAYQMPYDGQRVDALKRRFGIDADWEQRVVKLLKEKMIDAKLEHLRTTGGLIDPLNF